MSNTICIFFLLLLCSCSNSVPEASKDLSVTDSISKPKVTPKKVPRKMSPDEIVITDLFDKWAHKEVKTGRFFPSDSCNMEWFAHHTFNGTIEQEWGVPDGEDGLRFSFADLNGDGKLDGLAAFNPLQCDGGNGSMWSQIDVFFISNKEQYGVTEKIDVSDFAGTDFDEAGFYWLDSIGPNKIYGTYFEFKTDDGHCCPSTNKAVTFDFMKKRLIFLGKNKE